VRPCVLDWLEIPCLISRRQANGKYSHFSIITRTVHSVGLEDFLTLGCWILLWPWLRLVLGIVLKRFITFWFRCIQDLTNFPLLSCLISRRQANGKYSHFSIITRTVHSVCLTMKVRIIERFLYKPNFK
jgi:hypothetical protein